MENNIFKDTYFGKAYKTRKGEKVLFQRLYDYLDCALLFNKDKSLVYNLDGSVCNFIVPEDDIVSEWEEEIDEESVKLDARANMPFYCYCEDNKDCADAFVEGALYGYHKAKNE